MSFGVPPRRRRRRGPVVVRWLVRIVAAAVLFAVGIAVGQALEDRPEAGEPVTRVATIEPWTQTGGQVTTRTVTVTTP